MDTIQSNKTDLNTIKIHRSDSYRHIIEAEDESASFINRFNPGTKFIDIKPMSRSKTVKMYELKNIHTTKMYFKCFEFVDLDFSM